MSRFASVIRLRPEKEAQDKETKRWWTFTDLCQQPVDSAATGEWWSPVEEVFHLD